MQSTAERSLKKLSRTYDEGFYASQVESSYVSALAVLPKIVGFLPQVKTILDVGCGVGTWLKAAQDIVPGIEITGIDHPGVASQKLLISPRDFIGFDLTQDVNLSKRFDLAMSLEVAEHLPADAANTFVDNLVRHSPVVIFSAAVPGQGGTEHVNEQWPSYWIEKFSSRGYRCHDVVRPIVWDDENVQFWYRQNIFMFSSEIGLEERLRNYSDWGGSSILHPACLGGGLGISASARVLMKSLVKRFGRGGARGQKMRENN